MRVPVCQDPDTKEIKTISEPAFRCSFQARREDEQQNPIFILFVLTAALADDFQNAILTTHNQMRAKYNLAPLTWSAAAANVSQTWASKCGWAHNSNRSGFGENIYGGSGGAVTTSDLSGAVNSWNSEEANYDCNTNTCASGEVCGHFTQVVWRSTTAVGCGWAACTTGSPFTGFPNWKFVVCDYSPAGNYNGQAPLTAAQCNYPNAATSASPSTSLTTSVARTTASGSVTPSSSKSSNAPSTSGNAATSSTTSGGSSTPGLLGNATTVLQTTPGTASASSFTFTVLLLSIIGCLYV
ncbi:scp-like family protein [Planoprotostelium fungivorum]|uniref:Scp-like family protein n=1 Tax=Planoprotostelium fungivorum TaxID=1890364 RepID=A0A2P6NI42_9EUKA|nr:scp-like family protein [Planoprotostelium fungivorum]